MKRLTLKISKQDHKNLKLLSVNEDSSIKALLTIQLKEFVKDYIGSLKKWGRFEFKNIPISKIDAYSESEDMVTVSIEIEESLHFVLKCCCELEGYRLKHLVRSIILELINQ